MKKVNEQDFEDTKKAGYKDINESINYDLTFI